MNIKERLDIMNPEELQNHFTNIILPYYQRLLRQSFSKQEYLIEKLMIETQKEFLRFSPQNSKAREEWHILERVFFSQLLGLIEDKSYEELKYKLKEFSKAITNTLLNL